MEILDYKKVRRKAMKTYNGQCFKCYNEKSKDFKWYGKKGIVVEYNQKDFVNWYIEKSKAFRGNSISIGRIDHKKNYSFDNIEMIEHLENSREAVSRTKIRAGKTTRVKVFSSKTNELIAEFHSTRSCASFFGFNHTNLYDWCKWHRSGKSILPNFRFELEKGRVF